MRFHTPLLGVDASEPASAAALQGWIAAHGAEEAAGQLQAAGVAASAVLNARDLLLNEQLQQRGAFTPVLHAAPVNGYMAHPHAASPWLFTPGPRPPLREAPAVGQDSRAILREWLELGEDEVESLIGRGVVGVPVESISGETQVKRRLAWRLIAGHDRDPGAMIALSRDSTGLRSTGGAAVAP